MLVAVILACEVAFWVFIAAGLVARYVCRWRRTGAVLLALSPVVDVVILAASVVDLRHGATAGIPHVLSAVYLGISVAFGHRMITAADTRFAHRFAGGPAPVSRPSTGPGRARHEAAMWLRHLLASAVGVGLMGAAVLLVGDLDRTQVLLGYAALWTAVIVVDGLVTAADVSKHRRRLEPQPISADGGSASDDVPHPAAAGSAKPL